MKLCVLRHLCQFFSPSQLLTLHKDLIAPCMEYSSNEWRFHSHSFIRYGLNQQLFILSTLLL
ncbi:hypothetical protein E2C01_020303 [Portunus trituberculatus]|uniref:Uncharacterized protein n=1 Tax=Portunus trituberculatus TaxID=210409 RepID=A0A5B7DZR8_PORTR|nr:hypothetical protein [Portunus trituberculatus]